MPRKNWVTKTSINAVATFCPAIVVYEFIVRTAFWSARHEIQHDPDGLSACGPVAN